MDSDKVCRTLTLVANNDMMFNSTQFGDTMWSAIIPKGSQYKFNENIWGATTRRFLAPIQQRMRMLSKEFFDGGEYLTFTLAACNAVISGSTALHFLLPKSTTSWMPTDLDIYVPMHCQLQLGHLLKNKGYCLQKQVRANNPPLKIYSLMTFGNMEKKNQCYCLHH